MKNYLILTTAALMFAACSNNGNEPETTDILVPVAFNGSVGGSVTVTPGSRAVDQAWSVNDAIGIFMVKAGQPLLPANISEEADNIRYVVDAVAAIPGTNTFRPDGATIYYPMDNSTVDFYAYYPQGTVSSNYLYTVNVAVQTHQEALDLMYSHNVKAKKKTDKTAALSFKHQLCKVRLTIEPGSGVSADELGNLTIKVNGQNTIQDFNLTTGGLEGSAGVAADIALHKTDAAAFVYEAILLPDAATDRTFEFDLNNDHDAPFTWNMNKALTAGNKYTYTVRLNRTGVEVTGQIEAWTPEGGGTVDAN